MNNEKNVDVMNQKAKVEYICNKTRTSSKKEKLHASLICIFSKREKSKINK